MTSTPVLTKWAVFANGAAPDIPHITADGEWPLVASELYEALAASEQARQRAEAEVERLWQYAHHRPTCTLRQDGSCTCGLVAALAPDGRRRNDMAHGILRKVLVARKAVSQRITDFASRGHIAAGMAGESYDAGYRDALDDVINALDGVEPNRWRSWAILAPDAPKEEP